MLIRNYTYYANIDGEVSPFIIQNAPSYHLRDHDLAAPSDDEISAPGLTIVPGDSSQIKGEDFWHSFTSSYRDKDLPEEIISALRGDSETWKLIRCVPSVYGRGEGFNMFLVLVNPSVWDGHKSRGDSLEDELAAGMVWAWLTEDAACHPDISIIAPSSDGVNPLRYDVKMWTSSFIFTEHAPDGRVLRHSKVGYTPAENGLFPIDVTEYV